MLSGFAVCFSVPLDTEQLAPWFHSSCWLPLFPCPASPSADELSTHFVQSTAVPLNSSSNLRFHVPAGPSGTGLAVGVGVGVGERGNTVTPPPADQKIVPC